VRVSRRYPSRSIAWVSESFRRAQDAASALVAASSPPEGHYPTLAPSCRPSRLSAREACQRCRACICGGAGAAQRLRLLLVSLLFSLLRQALAQRLVEVQEAQAVEADLALVLAELQRADDVPPPP
jgi:hypothetical protein